MLQYSSLKVTLNINEEIGKPKFVEKWPVVLTIALGISAAFLQVSLIVESMTHDEKYLAMQISSHMFSNLLCISKVILKLQLNYLLLVFSYNGQFYIKPLGTKINKIFFEGHTYKTRFCGFFGPSRIYKNSETWSIGWQAFCRPEINFF